ncbi:MAG: motility protein A [Lachnospira sp.]
MDIATLLGIVLGFVMVIFGIITSGSTTLKAITDAFIDVPSIFVTIGGSISGMLASYTFKSFLGHLKGFSIAMKDPKLDNAQVISKIIELSNTARKEGLLALEEIAQGLDDEFMKKGILLIVDGTEPELVRGILETELVNLDTRHRSTIGFFDNWAALAPAWGMIGTLIGLVNMLKNLSDTASIGPSMAVALLTTLYGSLIANWICVPISNKLKLQNNDEYQLKEIVIEGLLSIQAGENPRVIEEKLKSFLAPSARTSLSDERGGEG